MGGWFQSERALGVAVILAAALYRPFVFWAANAWDLMRPIFPVLIGLALGLAGASLYLLLSRLTSLEMPLALGIAMLIVLLVTWESVAGVYAFILVGLLVAFVPIASRVRAGVVRGVALGVILFFGVGGVAQVLLAHLQGSDGLPLVPLEAPQREIAPTGRVEDVLVVVVDSYPALRVAEDLMGHDASPLTARLTELRYEILELAWSQHSFTFFAVPAIMELRPVVAAGSREEWSHSRNLSEIMGGDNYVAHSLRSAGYEYSHIEGGSDSTTCHDVDLCLGSAWLNESLWEVLQPTVIGAWLEENRRSWMVGSTLIAREKLISLRPIFGDGERDFVFAHLMLPHEPYVVDADCELRPLTDPPSSRHERISAQLSCVDGLLLDIAALASDDTAVIITGDHGAKTRNQISVTPAHWTAQDIAEAFGVFLAYRLPEGCESPSRNINTYVMRAIISCAVDVELPPNDGELLIGLHDYRWVTAEEQARIESDLLAGRLAWVEDEVLGVRESGADS